MNPEEKASLLSGSGFWHTKASPALGLPSLHLSDGPHGVRAQPEGTRGTDFSAILPATAFPTASLSASSFDPGLLEELGRALAAEAARAGVDILLGPGANIKRSPLCGRNFEYFSEDPLLSSRLAAAWIRGLESGGVGASLKHFAVNNQEGGRMTVDAVLEPRALREIYLRSFEGAVREGRPSSLMCAYNKVNGVHCSENPFLLSKVLREEWGHAGLVITDWGASCDRVEGLRAGVDLEMPEGPAGEAAEVAAAVREGRLPEAALDASLGRLASFAARRSGRPVPPPVDDEAHHELARRMARESMVLLRNEGGILPLSPTSSFGLIGELARSPRYQGAGSSLLMPTRLESVLDAFAARGLDFAFAPGYRLASEQPDHELEAAACELAKRVGEGGGSLVFVLGLPAAWESEGFDRTHLRLPANQVALLAKVARLCPRLVAVYVGGAPVETPWIDDCRAFLAAYLGGQASGPAVCDLLFGDFSPSGHLAETWPLRLEDCPATGNFPGSRRRVLYKEGIFVGYRWYASAGLPVRFPFGFGLAYTTFEFSDARLSSTRVEAGGRCRLSFVVSNTGSRRGKEVAQVYASFPSSRIERPALALVAFGKVELEPGESRVVEVEIGDRAFSHWDEGEGRFVVESGTLRLSIGPSSADLPLSVDLLVEGRILPDGAIPRLDLARHPSTLSDEGFEARLGSSLPPLRPARPYDLDSAFAELGEASVMLRLVRKIMAAAQARELGARRGSANRRMLEEMIGDMPLRKLVALSGGRFGARVAEGFCLFANGRRLLGLLSVLGVAGRRRAPPSPADQRLSPRAGS